MPNQWAFSKVLLQSFCNLLVARINNQLRLRKWGVFSLPCLFEITGHSKNNDFFFFLRVSVLLQLFFGRVQKTIFKH